MAALDMEDIWKAQQGDAAAMGRVVEKYYPEIFAYAWRLLGEEEMAQDCVQEVFLRAVRSFGTLRDLKNVKAWLFRICINVSRDLIKARKKLQSLDDISESATPADESGPTAEDLDAFGDLRGRLANEIDKLPWKLKEILELRQVQGLSFREISDALGIPLNTALARMRYALMELRKRLAGKVANGG